jgi:RecA-family ATPase
MEVIEQARKYIAAIPGAVSGQGGHDQTFTTACALVHGFALSDADALAILREYNARCTPAWSEHELTHKIESAAAHQGHQKPRGHLISKRSVRYKFGAGGNAGNESRETPAQSGNRGYSASPKSVPPAPSASKPKAYDLSGANEIPKPVPDGTRELLKAAFKPGEWVSICQARTGEDGREIPKDDGLTLTLEEWLKRLDKANGDPNAFMRTTDKNGIYIRINPMKQGGSRDAEVTDFRHALIEFDQKEITAAMQWLLIRESNIPCTAVVSSGGKSLHAWVRVDAKDRREYDERVAALYAHFDQQQRPDPKNKNPSRLSRLANCMRGDRRQELLALRMGAESFSAWLGALETDGIGRVIDNEKLLSFKPEDDATTLLGERWVCEGGSVLWVGQSGIGKSSLSVQAQVCWAVGRSFFGIKSPRLLRSLVIQAENDDGDLAEMTQGVIAALELTPDEIATWKANVVTVQDATHTSEAFTEAVRRLIDRYKPNLVWFDPLLSFIGDDVSKQAVCSHFLRTLLGPISAATGVAWMMVHHVGKPPQDKKARKGWTATDYSYAGTGSSELTNWARAVCLLHRIDDEHFELKLAKRGKRAGAVDLEGHGTLSIWLKHAEQGIHWQQIAEPVKESRYSTNKNKDGKTEFDEVAFMASVGGSVLKYSAMIDRISEFGGVCERKAKDIWTGQLKDHFTKDSEGFYRAQ